jgi:multidrug efflux pump subunit AcrA (membrane-fusion protein)
MQNFVKLIFILLLIAAAGCSGDNQPPVNAQAEPTSTPIPTAPAVARPTYIVQRGDVQEILEFSGRWLPRDQASLSFEIGGTIRRVNVRRGDTVTAGQLLADYEITDLEDQLASAQLELENAISGLNSDTEGGVQSVEDLEVALANARLSLEQSRINNPWQSVAQARVALTEAEHSLENAQRNYDDALSHPEAPGAADAVDGAYEALQAARAALQNAETSYFSAAASYNAYQLQIAQAENAVISAEIALERGLSGAGDPEGQQAVRGAQLSIDQINADIARSSLYSPIDGTVLEVNIQPGDAVEPFTAVIVVGLLEPHEVIASIAFGDTQRLSVGLGGTCNVLNRPETAVQCVIRQLPLSARDADQTTRVAASLEEVAADQSVVEAQMPLEVRENVLWLPPVVIRTFQNRTFVVLQTPDGPRSVDVQIGLQTDERVEIISGVNEGDVIEAP